MCAPEDRKIEKRKEFGARYGDWQCKVDNDSISWWMSLWGVPDGVMRLLYCSLSRFKDMNACFKYIDNPTNGELTLMKTPNSY